MSSTTNHQHIAVWRMIAAIGIMLFGIGFLMLGSVQVMKYYDPERRRREQVGLEVVKKWLGQKSEHDPTDDKYFARVPISQDKPRLEFYFRSNCPGCVAFKPIWKEFVDTYPPSRFIAIDPIDADKVDCSQSGIHTVPAIVFRAHATSETIKYPNGVPKNVRELYKWTKLQIKQDVC